MTWTDLTVPPLGVKSSRLSSSVAVPLTFRTGARPVKVIDRQIVVPHRAARRHDLGRTCRRIDLEIELNSRLVENTVVDIGQHPTPAAATEAGGHKALEFRHWNIGERDVELAGDD